MAAHSETLTIKIEHGVYNDAVFLRWYNPIAGWDSWLFAGDLDEGLNIEKDSSFRKNLSRVDTILQKPGIETKTLRTGFLTAQQARAISYVHTSPRVQMIDKYGNVSDVKVSSGTFAIIVGAEKRQSITFDIEIGLRNSQTN